jgi:hypothetical protein
MLSVRWEVEVGVGGVESQAVGIRAQCRRKVAEHLEAAGDQGVELPDNGVDGGRSADSSNYSYWY